MMRMAAIYARVSSEQQREENTIASQTAALIEFAKSHDLEVPREWVLEDEGYSGATLERPGLERVRDLAAEGQIQVMLAYSPDRLSRKYAYQILLIEEFARHGVETVFVKSPQGDSAEDQMDRSTPSHDAVTCGGSPELSSTAFNPQPPDLPPVCLVELGFAVLCQLAPHRRPHHPVLVHRLAPLIHASFRPRLTTTPLRFSSPSPPPGWAGDFHPLAVEHVRHTEESPGRKPRERLLSDRVPQGRHPTPAAHERPSEQIQRKLVPPSARSATQSPLPQES